MSDVLEKTEEKTTANDGDHDVFSHYVNKAAILDAQVNGKPARALCGKIWVPNKDPEKYPICPECQELYNKLK